jgi:hypothetical protein
MIFHAPPGGSSQNWYCFVQPAWRGVKVTTVDGGCGEATLASSEATTHPAGEVTA